MTSAPVWPVKPEPLIVVPSAPMPLTWIWSVAPEATVVAPVAAEPSALACWTFRTPFETEVRPV